jgi:hypothetical protein
MIVMMMIVVGRECLPNLTTQKVRSELSFHYALALFGSARTAMTPISAETASMTTPQPMERKEIGERRKSETVAAALDSADWRSLMDRTIQ